MSESTTAPSGPTSGRGDPYAAWTAGELEHAVPALKAGGIQHRLRHDGPASIDMLSELTPRRGD